MAVREFTDASGRAWRAWDINPEAIHPQTKAEDYLADCYQSGWIVFETVDGSDKRRFYPPPRGWDTFEEEQLRGLLSHAERIPVSKLARERSVAGETPQAVPRWSPATADIVAVPSETVPNVTDLRVVRSFHYPGGRLWSATLAPNPSGGGTPVLRFSAGRRELDLERWPREWPDYPDERLVELLRSAAPRKPGSVPPPGIPGRRYTDRTA